MNSVKTNEHRDPSRDIVSNGVSTADLHDALEDGGGDDYDETLLQDQLDEHVYFFLNSILSY